MVTSRVEMSYQTVNRLSVGLIEFLGTTKVIDGAAALALTLVRVCSEKELDPLEEVAMLKDVMEYAQARVAPEKEGG